MIVYQKIELLLLLKVKAFAGKHKQLYLDDEEVQEM